LLTGAAAVTATGPRDNACTLVQVEEFYVITWDATKECVFEMPTGGAAIMRKGPNLLKLARKEQCLALLTQLRNTFKLQGCIYRVFPNGEVQYLHPKDGQYPEKVNPGREQSNTIQRTIGQNPNPIDVRVKGWGKGWGRGVVKEAAARRQTARVLALTAAHPSPHLTGQVHGQDGPAPDFRGMSGLACVRPPARSALSKANCAILPCGALPSLQTGSGLVHYVAERVGASRLRWP